VFPKH
jgi:hypothetical protein